jgi:hypothetical protein
MPQFCVNVDRFINQDPNHVALVHSKAGKGRAGMMMAAYRLYCSLDTTPQAAIAHAWSHEVEEAPHLTPSQTRYLSYLNMYLQDRLGRNLPPNCDKSLLQHIPGRDSAFVHLESLTIDHFGAEMGDDQQQFWLLIQLGMEAKSYQKWVKSKQRSLTQIKWSMKTPIRVVDDFKIEILARNPQSKTARVIFYMCLNTRFLTPDGIIEIPKQELDKAYKDKLHIMFDERLQARLEYSPQSRF